MTTGTLARGGSPGPAAASDGWPTTPGEVEALADRYLRVRRALIQVGQTLLRVTGRPDQLLAAEESLVDAGRRLTTMRQRHEDAQRSLTRWDGGAAGTADARLADGLARLDRQSARAARLAESARAGAQALRAARSRLTGEVLQPFVTLVEKIEAQFMPLAAGYPGGLAAWDRDLRAALAPIAEAAVTAAQDVEKATGQALDQLAAQVGDDTADPSGTRLASLQPEAPVAPPVRPTQLPEQINIPLPQPRPDPYALRTLEPEEAAGALGEPVEGTTVATPQLSGWPPADRADAEHATVAPTADDLAAKVAAEKGTASAAAQSPQAASSMQHFLGGSGVLVGLNVGRTLGANPALNSTIGDETRDYATAAVQDAQKRGVTGPVTYPIVSPVTRWIPGGGELAANDSGLGSGQVSYAVVGQVTVTPQANGTWAADVATTTHLHQVYDGQGTAARTGVSDETAARLNRAGLGTPFVLEGTSRVQHWHIEYPAPK